VVEPNAPQRDDSDDHALSHSAVLDAPAFVVEALPYAPVDEPQRVVMIDVLRGFAVLGILLVNIAYFAFPVLQADAITWWQQPWLEGIAILAVDFFCSFKFITLFSMLFGIGLALQNDRAKAAGRPFAGFYARRLGVLLLIGLLHGTLLWYGDILTVYALLGFVALLCRNFSAKVLLIVAIALFLVPVLGLSGCQALSSGDDIQIERWTDLGKPIAEGIRESSASKDDADAFVERLDAFLKFLDDEERIYAEGTFWQQAQHRTIYFVAFNAKLGFLVFGWRCLSMFLLGMFLVRIGVFRSPHRSAGLSADFVKVGLPLGVGVQTLGFLASWMYPGSSDAMIFHTTCLYVGSVGLTLAYLGIIATLCLRTNWLERMTPLAAVGRMALTNYLGHSIICGLIFYSHGLGLFGQVNHLTALLIAMGIFVVQWVASPIWLRHFRFGPVEWLWRTLTYGKRQPFVRRSTCP